MPTQTFLVNPVWWLHVTEDLATVCLCLIEIMMISLISVFMNVQAKSSVLSNTNNTHSYVKFINSLSNWKQ